MTEQHKFILILLLGLILGSLIDIIIFWLKDKQGFSFKRLYSKEEPDEEKPYLYNNSCFGYKFPLLRTYIFKLWLELKGNSFNDFIVNAHYSNGD